MPIDVITVDSSNMRSELCYLGELTGTDKSPYNKHGHRHPYTAVYNMLFSALKYKPIRFAEIGVAGGASALMWDMFWRNKDMKIFCFDRDENFLKNAAKLTPGVTYGLMDVSEDHSVERVLERACEGKHFDIILDDSSHQFEHQIRIINEAFPYLGDGGMLIIEDIFRDRPEKDYEEALTDILPLCAAAYFVNCEHAARWSPGWNNDKLLVLVKAKGMPGRP